MTSSDDYWLAAPSGGKIVELDPAPAQVGRVARSVG